MSKNILAITVIVILVLVGAWFLIRKSNNGSNLGLGQSLSPTPIPTPAAASSQLPIPASKVIDLGNGLKIQDLVLGSGTEAKKGDKVTVNYEGQLSDGNKFDSSYDRGTPFQFTLGSGQVIRGWDLGVVGMKVGGKRILVIPPNLAYGNKSVGNGLIPANSTLIFLVELISVGK